MRVCDRAALSDVFEGSFLYRNLVPADRRLGSIDAYRGALGLKPGEMPRKADPKYAQVVACILRDARRLHGARGNDVRVLYVGDTPRNDLAAFRQLCRVTGWPGRTFIGGETEDPPSMRCESSAEGVVFLSNRWGNIADFAAESAESGFGRDESTVILVDIDKTLLGARGRNDAMIDLARREAAFRVAWAGSDGAIGGRTAFDRIYASVNRSEFHPLTEDNQDAVVYVTLLLAGGWVDWGELTARLSCDETVGFAGFLDWVERNRGLLPRSVAMLHDTIRDAVSVGSPTPFLDFRRVEYHETVKRMGQSSDETPAARMLAEEVVITEEVWDTVKMWKACGALLFAVSDKPDEACFPQPADEAAGLRPIHGTDTHVVGGRE
jgi:hypothetical protein